MTYGLECDEKLWIVFPLSPFAWDCRSAGLSRYTPIQCRSHWWPTGLSPISVLIPSTRSPLLSIVSLPVPFLPCSPSSNPIPRLLSSSTCHLPLVNCLLAAFIVCALHLTPLSRACVSVLCPIFLVDPITLSSHVPILPLLPVQSPSPMPSPFPFFHSLHHRA